jgi:hypothetical protein
MNNEFTGRVSQYVDKSGKKKSDQTPYVSWQIVVDEEDVQYPDSLVAEYYGEKIAPPELGSVVKIGYHVRSSSWEGKHFGSNNIWKIDLIESAPKDGNGAAPRQTAVDPLAATPVKSPPDAIGETDPKSGLPF